MVRHFGMESWENAAAQHCTIAVVCSYTVSLANFRYRLLAAMVENGHRVVAFGPENDERTIAALQAIGVEFRRIPMERAGLNPLEDLRSLAHLWRQLRGLSPDVILCYTMKPIIYGLIAARLARISRRYALVTGLGYVFSPAEQNPRLHLIRRIATVLYRIALRGCRCVFVYNDADAQDIREGQMISGPTRLVAVAGSGVDLVRFKPVPLPASPVTFLMIARLLNEKGAREFVQAAALLRERYPKARFQILGPLDPSPLAISQDEIEGWSASGVIEYLGETSDVRPYLAKATVFVLPSYYREGVPRSILEAMAMGRPVITANTPGCRDTVIEGENGFIVAPRSPEELAAAMDRFLANPALAARMGQRSIEIARDRFDVERINAHLLTEMNLINAMKR
ncbi:glycosyltransferase family 4 protein [Rhodoligotrophos ferricapiens]|uniref:glycosyltransferase family 4 protein n=1 Tax=Rhodoligotrophos ferricapiens TaxID=3069264 RepID=UPI00315D6EA2